MMTQSKASRLGEGYMQRLLQGQALLEQQRAGTLRQDILRLLHTRFALKDEKIAQLRETLAALSLADLVQAQVQAVNSADFALFEAWLVEQ